MFQRPNFIPPEAFQPILDELAHRSLAVNNYRIKTGTGRSQAFGLVNKRCLPPDYSRQCWRRPKLYKLLLDFGNQYVTDISWNAITVNEDYKANKHYDRGNDGPSFLVAFGEYEGGRLLIHEHDISGAYTIKNHPIVTDFSKHLHSVEPFTGRRISLVYYKLARTPPNIPSPSVEWEGGAWVFKRGGTICRGMPHPLRKDWTKQ